MCSKSVEEKREQIKTVMRYSGPRMMLYHPITAIRHLVLTTKAKQNVQAQLVGQGGKK